MISYTQVRTWHFCLTALPEIAIKSHYQYPYGPRIIVIVLVVSNLVYSDLNKFTRGILKVSQLYYIYVYSLGLNYPNFLALL